MTRLLKSAIALVLALVTLGASSVSAQAHETAVGVFESRQYVTFYDADDTATFVVDAVRASGTLTVSTKANIYCAGDIWISVLESGRRYWHRIARGTGDGTANYSGAVSMKNWDRGTVTVLFKGSTCEPTEGTLPFPKGVSVKFNFSETGRNNLGMTVTPTALPAYPDDEA